MRGEPAGPFSWPHSVEEDEGAGGEPPGVGEGGDGEVALDGALRVEPGAGAGEVGEGEAASVECDAQHVLLAFREALGGRGGKRQESGAELGGEPLAQFGAAGADENARR